MDAYEAHFKNKARSSVAAGAAGAAGVAGAGGAAGAAGAAGVAGAAGSAGTGAPAGVGDVDVITSASVDPTKDGFGGVRNDVLGGRMAMPGRAASAPVETKVPDNHYGKPIEQYSQQLSECDPAVLSASCGVPYDHEHQRFQFRMLTRNLEVRWPSGDVRDADNKDTVNPVVHILALRRIIDSTPSRATGNYLAFNQVPWGATYIAAFNRRCTDPVSRMFETAEEFAAACEAVDGKVVDSKADAAYEFEFLEGVFVRLQYWEGDDEFPAQAKFLFSDNIASYFKAADITELSGIMVDTLRLGRARS